MTSSKLFQNNTEDVLPLQIKYKSYLEDYLSEANI